MWNARIIRSLLYITALVTTTVPAASEDSEVDVWEECRSSDTCIIEYEHLSNQKTEPFLFLGYVMNSEQTRWRQFRRAIHEYPDVLSCLIEEERSKEPPNLLKFDWERVGYGRGAEVCLFRISRSLSDLDRIQNWLSFHQFKVLGYHRTRSEGFVPYRESEPVGKVFAYWTTSQLRERKPSALWSLLGYDPLLRYEVVIGMSEEFQAVGVSIVTPTQ